MKKKTQNRNTENRSISFDPELFQSMEERRQALMMDRSSYIKYCVLRDLQAKGGLVIDEVSSLVPEPVLRGKVSRRK